MNRLSSLPTRRALRSAGPAVLLALAACGANGRAADAALPAARRAGEPAAQLEADAQPALARPLLVEGTPPPAIAAESSPAQPADSAAAHATRELDDLSGTRAPLIVRTPARAVDAPPPVYPPLALRLGEQGEVLLRVALDEQGAVQSVELQASSGYARLDAAALAAVRHWRFEPAHRGILGEASIVLQPVVFRLSGRTR